jgi:hypothetical protein
MLCIPLGAKHKKIKTIGYRTRFKDEDKIALKKVLNIAKKTNANVKCLYVKTQNSDISKDTIEKWQKEFEQEPVAFFVVASDEIKDVVLDFVLEKKIDVLAMITYKRGVFADIFKPRFAVNNTPDFETPILEIPVD